MDWTEAARQALGVRVAAVIPLGARSVRLQLGGGGSLIGKAAGEREAALYRAGLEPGLTGAPALLWQGGNLLFLEDLGEAYPDLTVPADVTCIYRHLGAMHRRFLGAAPAATGAGGGGGGPTPAEVLETLAAFPGLAPEAAARLTAGPPTLVHGDYHRWNLALAGGQSGPAGPPGAGRVRLLDWEHAAAAPPVWDLTLLAPDEPGWDGVPRGRLAELALRVYHQSGPLAGLAWPDFLRLHRLARLYTAARLARQYAARAAAAATPGAAAALAADAERERRRAGQIARQL